MMLRYGIPSYKRPECITVKTLMNAGVSPDRIHIAVQDANELELYKQKHPDIDIHFRETDCAAGNRNTLLKECGFPIVLMDDDITSIVIRSNGENFKKTTDYQVWEKLLALAKTEAEINGCSLIGIAANNNNIAAKNRPEYSFDTVLQGSCIYVLDDVLFDERWKMVEDYELSLRTILHGHTLRANYISVNKPKNGTNAGGLHGRYSNGELTGWIERLAKQYPMFKPNKAKTGGQVSFG